MENAKELQKLAQVFNTDNIITNDDIEQVLKGILVIMNSFKKDNQSLNKETKEIVENLFNKILNEHDKLKESVTRETSDTKDEVNKKLEDSIAQMKKMCEDLMLAKPKDGENGEDADEEEIVEKVLAQIKLPETEILTGDDIANRLESLEGDARLDFKALKNVPESKQNIINGGGWRNLYQMHDVEISAPTDNQVLTYDGTTNTWKNETSSGGTVGPGTINEIAYFDTTTSIASLAVATYPSLTELSYVKGLTSAVQTQLNAKAPTTSPTFATSITGSYLTASEMLITDGSKNIVSAPVATYPSLTELTYLKGVTSAIQTQLNAKQASDTQLTSLAGLSYSGNAGKFIRVNAGETDFELATISGTGTVTSVAMSVPTGLTVTGSPITTTGTLAVALDTGYVIPLQTTLDGYVKTDQTVGQTIGTTGARLTKLWATDLTVTNAITGSITGNAATVTNATLTTALTVNTGTVTLTGNVANTSVLTIGAGAVSVSGSNTGDQTSIVGITGTKAQFNTAVSDGDIVFLDSTDTITGAKTMTGLNSVLVSSSGLTVRNPANTFKYTVTGAAIAADRILNLPLITGTDTLASLGLAQTWTATQTFTTPVLGTPTSGTLTNCTGLPIAGLVASTSTAIGVGSIELGHASDTTLSRLSAGVLAVEGVAIGTRYSYIAQTSTYAILTTDQIIDCTANTFTITLPTAVGVTGKFYIIKNSGTGIITIATTSSQTIDGSTTQTLPTQYDSLTVVSDGANWKIIA